MAVRMVELFASSVVCCFISVIEWICCGSSQSKWQKISMSTATNTNIDSLTADDPVSASNELPETKL